MYKVAKFGMAVGWAKDCARLACLVSVSDMQLLQHVLKDKQTWQFENTLNWLVHCLVSQQTRNPVRSLGCGAFVPQ